MMHHLSQHTNNTCLVLALVVASQVSNSSLCIDNLSILHPMTDSNNVTQGSHPDSFANNFPSMKHRRFTTRPRTSPVVHSHFKEKLIHLTFLVWGRSASVVSDSLDITDPRRQNATFEDGIELVDDAEVSVHSARTMALCLTYKGATTIH